MASWKVYRNALYFELIEMGFKAEMEKRIFVYYKTHVVGDYCSDITVEDVVICELKTIEALGEADENQLINYLKATNIEVGLLLNFGCESLQFKRLVNTRQNQRNP